MPGCDYDYKINDFNDDQDPQKVDPWVEYAFNEDRYPGETDDSYLSRTEAGYNDVE